jgi:hypothetical protein
LTGTETADALRAFGENVSGRATTGKARADDEAAPREGNVR